MVMNILQFLSECMLQAECVSSAKSKVSLGEKQTDIIQNT